MRVKLLLLLVALFLYAKMDIALLVVFSSLFFSSLYFCFSFLCISFLCISWSLLLYLLVSFGLSKPPRNVFFNRFKLKHLHLLRPNLFFSSAYEILFWWMKHLFDDIICSSERERSRACWRGHLRCCDSV